MAVTGGGSSLPLSRIYASDQNQPNSVDEFEALAKHPTLAMEEGAPHNGGKAVFATVSNFAITSSHVSFEVSINPNDPQVSAQIFERFALRHSLSNKFDWNHTCWQIGRGNIYETLYRNPVEMPFVNRPKLFQLSDPPMQIDGTVACMMPFRAEFDDIYIAIKAACVENGMKCIRVDEIFGVRPIINDVVKTIDEAEIVVCDLSGRNPNVMYETGIAHTLGRETIILAQNIAQDVPFDLRHLRCIEYDGRNQIGRDALKARISGTISALRS